MFLNFLRGLWGTDSMANKTHYIAKDGCTVRNGSVRTYNRILEMLTEREEASTREILDFCNNYRTQRGRISQTGVTMTQLGNILAKYPAFVRIGDTLTAGYSGKYKIAVWTLRTTLEHTEEE